MTTGLQIWRFLLKVLGRHRVVTNRAAEVENDRERTGTWSLRNEGDILNKTREVVQDERERHPKKVSRRGWTL